MEWRHSESGMRRSSSPSANRATITRKWASAHCVRIGVAFDRQAWAKVLQPNDMDWIATKAHSEGLCSYPHLNIPYRS
jgi:hypothetical protein